MLLKDGIEVNYINDNGKLKPLEKAYADVIRNYQNDYKQAEKDFSDWKRNEYLKEALILSTAFPMGKGISKGIDVYKNYQRAKEIADLVKKRKDWGIAFRKAEGNPDLAVDTLIKHEKGFVPNIRNLGDKGRLDLHWGEHDPETELGNGLTHLIQRRNKKMDGEQFARTYFVNAIKNGRIGKNKNHPERFVLEDEFTEIPIADNWNGDPRNWVVTAYPKNKSAREHFASYEPVQQNFDIKNGYSILNSLADNNIITDTKDVFKSIYQKFIDKLNNDNTLK